MRAIYATRLGGESPLNNFELGARPEPTPGRGQVRVRMRAASLNHHDYWTLKGVVGHPITPPRILGCDGSGVVSDYGPDAPDGAPRVGAEVVLYPVTFCGACGACRGDDPMLCRSFYMLSDGPIDGSFADYVVLPAQNVVPKPTALTFEEAACMGTTYLTAFRMLFTKGRLRPGQRILVQGAGGGLATAAIQLGAAAGATVIVSSRFEEKLARAKEIGAHEAVLAGRDAAKSILKLTDGTGVDVVIESVGEPTWPTSVRAVRPGGAIVVSGATAGANPPADLARIFWRQLQILGSTEGTLAEFIDLLRFVERTRIKPVIDAVYPLDRASEAFGRLASGEFFGKLVFAI